MSKNLVADLDIVGQPSRYVSPRAKTLRAIDVLAARVGSVQRSFAERVAREEGRCGFFAFLTTAAPRYLTILDTLRSDHRQLTRALASLRVRILRADPCDFEELLAETDAVMAAIAEHESLERTLLAEALSPP